MVRRDDAVSRALDRLQPWLQAAVRPGPGVAEPEGWQQVEDGCIRPAIADADTDQYVFRGCLGIFDHNIEVAVAVENAAVEELILVLQPGAAAVRLHQV